MLQGHGKDSVILSFDGMNVIAATAYKSLAE